MVDNEEDVLCTDKLIGDRASLLDVTAITVLLPTMFSPGRPPCSVRDDMDLLLLKSHKDGMVIRSSYFIIDSVSKYSFCIRRTQDNLTKHATASAPTILLRHIEPVTIVLTVRVIRSFL